LSASKDGYAGGGGRHRRVDAELVVHLVFGDLSECVLGPQNAIGRSMGHLAAQLFQTWATSAVR
jgi:hypothetical protein